MKNMTKLLEIMASLRNPTNGCPWDIKQTFQTIVPYTLEEAYEVADSIERGQMSELKDELGDLLFQVVFYTQMAKEQGLFEFDDVVQAINDKLIRRHPHVFADAEYKDDQSLHQAWEQAKASERDDRAEQEAAGILDGVARALPSLKRAQKLQKRAASVGFDWPTVEPVLDKIEEEIQELREAMAAQDKAAQFEETGDLLFSCVNLARHLDIDAEEALRHGNAKFEHRFGAVEQKVNESDREFNQHSLDELEALWQGLK
ncbi:MAG: nucleoside triphosphate pyrophosphohydrolase [Gammaproteobacteria bacterium]|nr:nucleoside triphosphate pyrophosphohydrolase [Gammaproteobacteria bacterium]